MSKNYDISAKPTHYERKMARKARKQEKLQQILLQMEKFKPQTETKSSDIKDIMGLELSAKSLTAQETKEVAKVSGVEKTQSGQIPKINWSKALENNPFKSDMDAFLGPEIIADFSVGLFIDDKYENLGPDVRRSTPGNKKQEIHQLSKDNKQYTITMRDNGVDKYKITITAKQGANGDYYFEYSMQGEHPMDGFISN